MANTFFTNHIQRCFGYLSQKIVKISLLLKSYVAKPHACLMPWLQLRFDYDTTTIRLPRIVRACIHSTRFDYTTRQVGHVIGYDAIRREQKMNMSIFRLSRIVYSLIVVESQLWYRLYLDVMYSIRHKNVLHMLFLIKVAYFDVFIVPIKRMDEYTISTRNTF